MKKRIEPIEDTEEFFAPEIEQDEYLDFLDKVFYTEVVSMNNNTLDILSAMVKIAGCTLYNNEDIRDVVNDTVCKAIKQLKFEVTDNEEPIIGELEKE